MRRMYSLLSVLALGLLGAALANAGTLNTPLQHVIVIVQENRTPDNLFGADTALINAGAHIVSTGCWKCQRSSPSDIRIVAEVLFREPSPARSHGHIAPSPLL